MFWCCGEAAFLGFFSSLFKNGIQERGLAHDLAMHDGREVPRDALDRALGTSSTTSRFATDLLRRRSPI
jgi:hypothetical protein